MNVLSKKCLFLLNLSAGAIIVLLVISRFQDTNIFAIRVKKFAHAETALLQVSIATKVSQTGGGNGGGKLKIPWRFQIEEDGFVFPFDHATEKFVTYEPVVNGTWSEQILQFHNAVVVAYLLKRTLLAPPLMPLRTNGEGRAPQGVGSRVPFFDIVDSQVLNRKVSARNLADVAKDGLDSMSKRYICLDSRLGFWLDYIPSVENFQTWRMLRQQNVKPIDINNIRGDPKCPETIFGRWTYPKSAKPQYRGILTELTKSKEDVIYFYKDTLARTFLRIFDKQRAVELQELLLLYIRFTPAVNSRIKILINLLGPGYTAVVLNPSNTTEAQEEDVRQLRLELDVADTSNATRLIFATGRNISRDSFRRQFSTVNRRVVFGNKFVRENIAVLDGSEVHPDKVHLFEQLLSAYADLLIPRNMTSNTDFIRHLRINELFTSDGIAIENVNVRWAKHTTKTSVARFKKLKEDTVARLRILRNGDNGVNLRNDSLSSNFATANFTSVIGDKLKLVSTMGVKEKEGHQKKEQSKQVSNKENGGGGGNKNGGDQLSRMVCLFCNYIRHITGHHGCPTMRDVCSKVLVHVH